ncbi:hypothetical protein ACFX15_008604 [Malus domestica]
MGFSGMNPAGREGILDEMRQPFEIHQVVYRNAEFARRFNFFRQIGLFRLLVLLLGRNRDKGLDFFLIVQCDRVSIDAAVTRS